MRTQHREHASRRRMALAAGVAASMLAVVALTACGAQQGASSGVAIPADHVAGSMTIAADHANCQSCHDSLPERFDTTGSLMAKHMEVLEDYQNGKELEDEAQRILNDHAADMEKYFSKDTMANCATCHELGIDADGNFTTDIVFNEYCQDCHDDFDYIVEQTDDWGAETPEWHERMTASTTDGLMSWDEYTSYSINPHKAHGTNAACGDCHKIHQEEDSFYCMQCHIWAMPGDDGEETYSDWQYDTEMYRNWRSDNHFGPNEGKQG